VRPSNRSALKPSYVLLAIIVFAVSLRFFELTTVPQGIQVDEAMNGCNILEIHETGRFQIFYPENMGREGLFINLQALASTILGDEPWVLRAVSAAFGVATVWTTYLLAAELFSPWAGLLAAFFIAASYWHLMLSRLGTRAVSASFFLTLTLYLLLTGFRRLQRGESATRTMLLAGVIGGLGFHTYTAYRISPAIYTPILIYYFLAARRKGWPAQFWKACGLFIGTGALIVAPLAVYFIQHPAAAAGRASQVMVFSRSANPVLEILSNTWKTAQMFFIEGDHNWRHNYDARREVFWPVAILLALGIVIAVGRLVDAIRNRHDAFPYVLLLIWIAVAALPGILSGEGVPHALRCSLMIPAIFMLAAIGALDAWERFCTIPHAARLGLAAIVLLLVAWDPYHTYFELWAPRPEVAGNFSDKLMDLADRFNQAPRSVPKYVAVTSTGVSANGIPVLLMPFTYVTRSYTAREQAETNIHYLTPQNFRLAPGVNPAGKTFCQAVQESMPGANITCLNLRY
jgi:4-amino-4-deoxy-L-arabinose transferase-like glycosyltransferase